jgi:hypothetical protein
VEDTSTGESKDAESASFFVEREFQIRMVSGRLVDILLFTAMDKIQ